MKTAIWVVVYLTMCFLLFTGWMFAFAQYAPYKALLQIVGGDKLIIPFC